MAVSNLRRAVTVDEAWEEQSPDGTHSQISIEAFASEPVNVLCDDYPFDQTRHSGSLIYHEESEYTRGRDIELNFEYRDGSDLFIVELETDVPSIDKIIRHIKQALPTDLSIYRNLHAPEDSLWNFLLNADRIIDIQVLDEGTELPYKEVEDTPTEEVIGNFSIERATVAYQFDSENIVVEYRQGSLQINTERDQAREYIIQLFEREVLAE